MTVKEMIEQLQECNPDATVYTYDVDEDNDEIVPVHSVDGGFFGAARVDINYGK